MTTLVFVAYCFVSAMLYADVLEPKLVTGKSNWKRAIYIGGFFVLMEVNIFIGALLRI